MDCVLKDWVMKLPYRMQSVLMSSLRGCDTAKKDDPSKFITRGLRGVILHNADTSNSFINDEFPPDGMMKQFLWDLDAYPMHFIMHTAHAAEIIGYRHPSARQRAWWISFYRDVVKGLHLMPESKSQLNVRLGLTPDERKVRDARKRLEAPKKKQKWDAGTGTSHGGRNRSYSGSS